MNVPRETSAKAVWVRVVVPGFHHWPDAPDTVRFLAARHRHLFHVDVEWSVIGDNRELEFFLRQRAVRDALDAAFLRGPDGYEFDDRSCEQIAQVVAAHLDAPPSVVTVSEDDENGATVAW